MLRGAASWWLIFEAIKGTGAFLLPNGPQSSPASTQLKTALASSGLFWKIAPTNLGMFMAFCPFIK